MKRKLLLITYLILGFVLLGIPFAHAQTFSDNLYYGIQNNPQVSELQEFLISQGVYNGPVTSNFFSLTKTAVIKFQEQNDIQPASGFFGPLTRGVVNKLLSQDAAETISTNQQSLVQSSSPTSSPNTVLCNGSYYPACQTGQQFICANDGIQPYCQVPPPAATTAQIAEIAQLCSYATSQGSSALIQDCTDGTILSGYNTNTIFRENIDSDYTALQQKLSQEEATANNQAYVQNWISSLTAASEINQNFVSEQNSINAQATAEEEQEQSAQILRTVEQNQQLLQQMTNTPVQTHCGINDGAWDCNLPGAGY